MRNNLLSDGELLSSDGNLNEAGLSLLIIAKNIIKAKKLNE